MKTVPAPLHELAAQIEQLAVALAENGYVEWADRLRADAAKLRTGNRLGCADFLSHFGGAGSLNDISVGDSSTNEQFELLCTKAKAGAQAHYPTLLQQTSLFTRIVGCVGLCVVVLVLALAFVR